MMFRMVLFFLVLGFHSYVGIFSTILLPGISLIVRYVFVVTDVLMVALCVTVFWRNRTHYGARALSLFVAFALLTFIYNIEHMGPSATLNGLREPVFFLSSLVVVYDFFQSDLRDRFVESFTSYLFVFALLQLPASLYEVARFGATDHVGGTFGFGGSGILTQLLFLIAFYFVVRRGSLYEGTAFNIKKVFLYSILLIPCALNETKISFIFLPLFFSLIAFTSGKVYRAIPIVVLSVLLGLFWEYFYSTNVQETRTVFDIRYVERYLYSGDNSVDMPRLARIPVMFHLMRGDIGAILLGLGYGLFGGANVLGMTQLGKTLSFLGGSKILLFTIWIQGGLLAVLSVAFAMFGFMRTKSWNYYTLRRFKWFLFFSLIVMWVYNDAILFRTFAIMTSYFMVFIAEGGDGEALFGSLPAEDQEETLERS
ncbi:MAG: hypothetical protein IT282_02420 [Bacteroidetes bacterium]|nr:hypothetical protein [Bacteroidota bacterium]